MSKPKSCPSTETSNSAWDSNQLLDCYVEAYNKTPTIETGHRKFITNLEKTFPGLDLSEAKSLLPFINEGGSK